MTVLPIHLPAQQSDDNALSAFHTWGVETIFTHIHIRFYTKAATNSNKLSYSNLPVL